MAKVTAGEGLATHLSIAAGFGLRRVALGVDMFHSPMATTLFSKPIGWLEDGGEMMMMSRLLWFAFLVFSRDALGNASNV